MIQNINMGHLADARSLGHIKCTSMKRDTSLILKGEILFSTSLHMEGQRELKV